MVLKWSFEVYLENLQHLWDRRIFNVGVDAFCVLCSPPCRGGSSLVAVSLCKVLEITLDSHISISV